MLQQNTQTYYPSNFTLTVMDGFGTRKLMTKSSNKKLRQCHSLSKMPAFIKKQKITYDKESLLEQIRQQKQKSYFINITNNQLLKNISMKKLRVERPVSSLLSKQRNQSVNSPLKRQIEQLVNKIEQQNQEILRLKRSKKYNRHIELQTLKTTYLQEISQMKYKIRCFKNQLKQKRRIKKQLKKRFKDIRVMNLAVQQRIDTEKGFLSEKLQNLCLTIKDGMIKQISLKKQKQRLMKEINELQAKTGKIYINEESNTTNVKNQSKAYQNQIIKRVQKEYCFEQQDQEQYSQSNLTSNASQSEEWQQQIKQFNQQPKNRVKNLSF